MNPLEAIAKEVRANTPNCGQTRIVGIDGPAGSGKTTFAGHLAIALNNCPVIHLDDLYDGWNDPLNSELFERMTAQIFSPLKTGVDAKYQKYDWHKGSFEQLVEIPSSDFLIIEGVGALHPEIQKFITLGIWLESDPKGRLKRVLDRDGEDLKPHMQQWQKMEQAYFAKFKIAGRADFVLRTD